VNIISRHIKSEDSHWARRKNVCFDRKYPPEVATWRGSRGQQRLSWLFWVVLGHVVNDILLSKSFENRKCPIVTSKVFSSDTMIISKSNSIWPKIMRPYLVRGQPAKIRVNNPIHKRSLEGTRGQNRFSGPSYGFFYESTFLVFHFSKKKYLKHVPETLMD
jgi:hypothetical protein